MDMASSSAPQVAPSGDEKPPPKKPRDGPGCCGAGGFAVDPLPLGEAAGGGGGAPGFFFSSLVSCNGDGKFTRD